MGAIKLYHGGKRTKVENILVWGLESGQEFYCTRSKGLAKAAQHSHGVDGDFLEISIKTLKNESYCINICMDIVTTRKFLASTIGF